MLQLSIRHKAALYASYMPLLKDGGLFIPSDLDFRLGDDIYILLTLLDDPQRYPIAGKVAWITPAAQGRRVRGVGFAFPATEQCRLLRARIEQLLGAGLHSDRDSHTF